MADEKLENVQRWTAKRRTALVLQIVKGEREHASRPSADRSVRRGFVTSGPGAGASRCAGERTFITPYTPEQNGMIERFFRSLKEECTWQQVFPGYREAKAAIARWIRWYNEERPYQALNYRSPVEFRASKLGAVA